MKIDLSALLRCDTENILQELGSSRSVQTGDSENFTLSRHKGYILQSGILCRQVLHLQHRLADYIVLLRITIRQLTAYHKTDDLIHGKLLRRTRCNPLSVTHDRYIVRDTKDLLHLVGDIDNSAALIAQGIDDAE